MSYNSPLTGVVRQRANTRIHLDNYLCSRYDNADIPVRRWKYLQKLLAEEKHISAAISLTLILVLESNDLISAIAILSIISVGVDLFRV